MNKITAKLEKNELFNDKQLTINIDGKSLDVILQELYPKKGLMGLLPTLLPCLYNASERKLVWDRVESNQNQIVPILMSSMHYALEYIVVVVEVEKQDNIVTWKRIGLENGDFDELEAIGKEVEWLDKIQTMQFEKKEYEEFILKFKKEFEYEELINKTKKAKTIKEILNIFDDFIKLNPEEFPAYFLKASFLEQVKENKEAIKTYKKICELKSDEVKAYERLAVLLKKAKNYKESLKNYEKAIELEPTNKKYIKNRNILLKKLEEI